MGWEDDYHVRVSRAVDRFSGGFEWEIVRRSSPMGVRVHGTCKTEAEARSAGRAALARLLRKIARDRKNEEKKPSTRSYKPRG